MSVNFEKFTLSSLENQEQALEIMDKLFAVAQPGAVFAEPITVGEQTVITASEVKVGMGFGYGGGGGTGKPGDDGENANKDGNEDERPGTGFGIGGGGGGVSGGRPVAVISIGPDGVQVEPVVDATKLGLAFFTTLGTMFMMLRRMRRGS